jgi:hypothetical protein
VIEVGKRFFVGGKEAGTPFPALEPSRVLPSNLSFGHLSADAKTQLLFPMLEERRVRPQSFSQRR